MYKVYVNTIGKITVDSVYGNIFEAKRRVNYLVQNGIEAWYRKIF
uniref:Uncharacterized protein n=1 Tax=Dulem virus 36 TaxID=3145754 RepID=A0AAU8AYA6_9CAUD